MVEIQQVKEEQLPVLRQMMQEYLAWALSLEEGASAAPTFHNVDHELDNLPGVFAPPSGRLLVAELSGNVAGCIALKPIDEDTCELKRLFVRPSARGGGVGAALVDRVIRDARAIGYKRMILDSHMSMTGAHALYRAAGFKDVEPTKGFPEELKSKVVFMRMEL